MRKRTRPIRISFSPKWLDEFPESMSPWHETPAAIRRGLTGGARRAELLAWVRRQMGARLTRKQRRSIELYYFEGLTYREVAKALNTSPSSVHNLLKRGLHRLKAAARQHPPEILVKKRPGRRPRHPELREAAGRGGAEDSSGG